MTTYIDYTFYDAATGEINAAGQTPDDNLVEAPPGLALYLGGAYTRKTHSFVDGVPTPHPPSRALAQAKADKRQELAGAWQDAMQAGVTVGGKLVPTDPTAWVDYLTINAMAGEAGWVDTPIQLVDGSFELLTPAKAAALWTALKAHRRTTTAQLRDRVEAVHAAATVAAVLAIVW